MVAQGYEIYLRVFKSICHKWAQLAMYYSVYYINLLFTKFFDDFRRFPTIFRRLSKIFKMLSKGCSNVAEHFLNFSRNFQRVPKIAKEDPKMFRLNIDRCTHTCGYHFYPHMCDTISIDLLPLAIPLQLIYNNMSYYSLSGRAGWKKFLTGSHVVVYRPSSKQNVWKSNIFLFGLTKLSQ